MRRYLFVFLFVFLSLTTPSASFAKEATPEAQLSPTPEIEYTLPYPGILPDSPIYFLKVTRDRIISFLISDSVKKGEFNLLQADKRLGAGVTLAEKENYKLAESTFSKGLNYLEEAVIKAEEGKREGKDVKPLAERMTLSVAMHSDLYAGLEKSTPSDFQKQIDVFQKRLAGYEKRVKELAPQE